MYYNTGFDNRAKKCCFLIFTTSQTPTSNLCWEHFGVSFAENRRRLCYYVCMFMPTIWLPTSAEALLHCSDCSTSAGPGTEMLQRRCRQCYMKVNLDYMLLFYIGTHCTQSDQSPKFIYTQNCYNGNILQK